MSISFWIGLVILGFTIVFCIGNLINSHKDNDLLDSLIATMCIGSMFFIAFLSIGLIDTNIQMNKAKSGYILENDNRRIEVIQRKKNFVQFVYNNDTLIVNRHDWINNYASRTKIVNITNF